MIFMFLHWEMNFLLREMKFLLREELLPEGPGSPHFNSLKS